MSAVASSSEIRRADRPVHPVLARLFEAFERAGVAWCVLRSEDDLEAPEGDVDLLVAPGSLAAAGAVLRAHGFAELAGAGRGSHSFFLAYDALDHHWLEIDVVTELAYGPLFSMQACAADVVLKRRFVDGSVPTLAPEDAFWALALHCLLDRAAVPERHRRCLRVLARAALGPSPIASGARAALGASVLLERAFASVRADDWEDFRATGRALRRRWLLKRRRAVLVGIVRSGFRRYLGEVSRVRTRRGLTVAFLGVDGAGKSTLVDRLERDLRVPARTVYFGLWRRGTAGPRGRTGAAARALLRPADAWRRWLVGAFHRRLGRVVLFDRYTFDAYLAPQQARGSLKRLYLSLLARSCPRPDAVVLLDVPARVAARRKPEEQAELLEEQRRRLLALRGRIPDLIVIRSDQPLDAVARAATAAIWRLQRQRCEARR